MCYVFDEMRPFRLLRYVRHDWKHPHDEVGRHGKQAAHERLRDCVLSRLPRFSAAAS